MKGLPFSLGLTEGLVDLLSLSAIIARLFSNSFQSVSRDRKRYELNEVNGNRSRRDSFSRRGGESFISESGWGRKKTHGERAGEETRESCREIGPPCSAPAWFYPPTNHENLIEGLPPSNRRRQFSLYISNDVREVASNGFRRVSPVEGNGPGFRPRSLK